MKNTNIDTNLFVVTVVYFFVDEEEKCGEKQLYFAVNGKVSQSPRILFFIF